MSELQLPVGFMPLLGIDEATLDDKNRVLVSRKKRERLGENFAIAMCEAGCLACYPQMIWSQIVSQLLKRDVLDPTGQLYQQLIFSTADDEIKFDPQNRFVLSSKLKAAAGIDEKIKLVGDGHRIQLWAADKYDEFEKDREHYELNKREIFERAYLKLGEKPWVLR